MWTKEAFIILFVVVVACITNGDVTDEHGESKSIGQRRSIMNMFLDKEGDELPKGKSCSAKGTSGIENNGKQEEPASMASSIPSKNTKDELNGAPSSLGTEDIMNIEQNVTTNKTNDAVRFDYDEQDATNTDTDGKADTRYQRIRLPPRDHLWVGKRVEVVLPGDMETEVKVLSVNPLVVEVDNFIDDEECDLLLSLAKAKQPKVVTQEIQNMKVKSAKDTFREWDYNEDGVVTSEEVSRIPSLADIHFSEEDVEDMFFMLKMDRNEDGKIDQQEMKNTDFHKLNNYISNIKSQPHRQRNITSKGAWVWHDEDELLKFSQYGYFEEFHGRVSAITDIPTDIIIESEPLQVRHHETGQFQVIQQDSEGLQHHVPCCMYGDKKNCRNCRYISYTIFLNDVEEGGELVFPMANHRYQNLMNNSGQWRGYYTYSKSTGHQYYFQVDMIFQHEGANPVFSGEGNEDRTTFSFINGIVLGNQISFEKSYNNGEKELIRYSGKEIGGTKIVGNWWVPGNKRYRGNFFMWNKEYEIYSKTVIDDANHQATCTSAKLAIKPKKGKAVFWYNHHVDPLDGMLGQLNQESLTAHCEVTKGDKWTATSWINIIGDGDMELKAWRRGYNLLRGKNTNIYERLGTSEPKLQHEAFEEDFLSDIDHANGTVGGDIPGYYKHKPSSSALQALTLILNEMSARELKLLASNVEKKLGLQCIPLYQKKGDKMHVINGSTE